MDEENAAFDCRTQQKCAKHFTLKWALGGKKLGMRSAHCAVRLYSHALSLHPWGALRSTVAHLLVNN